MGSEAARHRRPWANTLRLFLVTILAFSLLAGCAPEPGTTLENELPPTSADLIAQALEAGEIDEPTSLLYRTWLFFGDSQLPEKFTGADAPYEYGLISEVRNKLDELPEDVRAQIEPYLLRPNDPESAFTSASPSTASASTASLVSAIQPVADHKNAPTQCTTSWLTVAVVGTNFRVWACDDPAALSGFTLDGALDFISDILIEYAPQMTADLGKLIPDDPSKQTGEIADDLIDVYALPTGWLGPYRQNFDTVPSYAVTIQTSPFVGKTASSYILVSLDHTADQPLYERILVHELFHAFQNTFNAKLNALWWVEGSAEWAASYYVRSDSGRLHEARMEFVMDLAAPSILLEGDRSVYGAYIWPFFMEQQKGAKAIFNSWRRLATLPAGADTAAVIAVLDQQVPVSASYPALALRLVNMQLAGGPIAPTFQELDANFPTGRHPLMDGFTLDQNPVKLNADGLLGLGYRDYRITVVPPPNHPPHTGVLVNVSGQAQTVGGKVPVLQALVQDTDGEYSRVRLAYNGDGSSVCVDKDMILVLANNSTQKSDATSGTIILKRLDDKPCTRIEVNHPEFFYALSDGDIVKVDGDEGDKQPDKTRLVVTVRDPNPKKLSEYVIKVRITGGTLRSARTFTWPLSSLENPSKGVWRQDVPLPLDIDLTDANRPLTIDARLERSGTTIDSKSPTVTLQGRQEALCYTDVQIDGQVAHRLDYIGGDIEYRPYPVHMSKRFEAPNSVVLVKLADELDTEGRTLQMNTGYMDKPVYGHDQFLLMTSPFDDVVPTGATGTFVFKSTMFYEDYSNIPLIGVEDWENLPEEQLYGRPLPDDAYFLLHGDATVTLTRNLPSAGILEGTITGRFTDKGSYSHGNFLNFTLTFSARNMFDCD